MKILVIDNNIMKDSWGAESLVRFARVVPGAEVITRRAPADDLPKDLRTIDKIVISGSLTSVLDEAPWIENLDHLIKSAMERGKHIFGVCYGHQTIARILGGKQITGKSATNEHGWTKIIRSSPPGTPDILFKDLPQEFWSFSSHYDEVTSVPPGAIQLASSERCGLQAYQVKGKPVFGIQFHPEKNLAECEDCFVRWKKNKKPANLMQPNDSNELYDPKVGETIFKNFFGLPL